MIVREATSKDLESILEMMEYLHPKDPKLSKSTGCKIFSKILESDGLTITLAEQNDQIVGSCYINIIPNLTRGAASYAVIENVVTHPGFRRQGIGRTLVTQALNQAKTAGCYKVMLLTGGDHGVQKFYESCGMKRGLKTAFIERW